MELKIKDKMIVIDKKLLIGIGAIIVIVILLLMFKPSKQNNLLTCEQNKSNATANTTERIKFYFKKNHLYKMESYYKNEPTADFQSMLQKIYDNYNSQLENLKNNGGYDYTITLGSSFVETNATIDIETIPDSTKDAVGFNADWLYNDVKKNLEENEFICK